MTRFVFEPIFSPPPPLPLHSLPKKRFHAIFLKEVFSSITILQSEWFTKHEINVFFFMRRHKNKMRNRSTFKGRLGNAKFDQLAMNSGLLQGKETVLWVAPANWFVWLLSRRSIRNFNIPFPGQPTGIWLSSTSEVGEFEPWQGVVGRCQVFPAALTCFFF